MNTLTITRVLDSTFEHVLNGGDPIIDNRPNITVFGDEFDFKTANGANLLKKQKIRFDEITVIDTFGGTGSFTFANSVNVIIKLIELKYFLGIDSTASTGATRFDQLEDGFTYFGQNGKVPVVNEAQSKLIATTFYNINKFTQLSDVAASALISGKYVTTALVAGQVKLVLSDLPEFPDALVNAVGYLVYSDLLTQTTPLAYTSGDLQITNDTLGENTILDQVPFGVTRVWDNSINAFDFSQLTIGDTIDIRFDFEIDVTSTTQTANLVLLFNEGEANEFELPFGSVLQFRALGTSKNTLYTSVYIGSQDIIDNPVKLIFRSNAATDITVNGFYVRILRKAVNLLDYNFSLNVEERVINIASTQAFYDLDFLPTKILNFTRNSAPQVPGIDYNISGVRITPTALQGDFVEGDVLYVVGALISDSNFDGTALDPLADHDKGEWDAGTNQPPLANGFGNRGDYYKVINGGTVNFGAGNITFFTGDIVGYDADNDIYYKKVNNNQNSSGVAKKYITFPINQNVAASTNWYAMANLQDVLSGDYTTGGHTSGTTDADAFASLNITLPCQMAGITGNITNVYFRYRSNATDSGQTIDLVVHKSSITEGSIQPQATVISPVIAARKVINPAYVADAAFHTFSGGEILSPAVTPNTVLRILFKNNNINSHIQDGEVVIEITQS